MVYQKENETGRYMTGTEYNPDKDFCGECKGKIVDFVEHFGIAGAESGTSYVPENENHARNEREEESIEVGTNPKEYGIFDEEEQTEPNEERYKYMTIKAMIREGLTDEEIMGM
jgi:hypothetical protein